MIDINKSFKLDLKNIEEIINEIKKPSSLNELSMKFGLPLTVKCVKEFYIYEEGTSMHGSPCGCVGKISTYNGTVTPYGYWKSTDDTNILNNVCGDSKKFILWEKN